MSVGQKDNTGSDSMMLIYDDHERDARTKSARYFLKDLLSKSVSLVANSTAALLGQPCAGRKADAKKL